MFLRRFLSNRKAPSHTLQGRDSETSVSEVATPMYIYYRIYDEDGPTTSKTPAPGDPFLGRINAQFVPPPYRDTARAVKRHIAKMENINDRESSSLFTSPYSKSPMGNTDKVTALNRTASCLGSTPQDPLAFVTKFSGSALESEGRGGLESAAEPDTTRDSEIRYVYYLLYADDYELPSKVAFDPEEPSLGRIRVDSIVPPHSSVTIKRCISRVERTPTIASVHAHLFAEISCNTPLKDDHISFLRTNYPGMSPKEPMAIVLTSLSPIPDGRYVIKNRTADFFWNAAWDLYMRSVYFGFATIETAMSDDGMSTQWDITHDDNGNILMSSAYATSRQWVGAEIFGSAVPVPWRLIQVDSKFYYLTTDMNRDSRNPRVPAVQPGRNRENNPGKMATLKEGDQRQMWEFIRVK